MAPDYASYVIERYQGEVYAEAVVGGKPCLVSMLGENVNWVYNLRAAGGRAVLRHG